MKRRSFLGGILACATPPGFVRQGVLMPVKPQIATFDYWSHKTGFILEVPKGFLLYHGARGGGKSVFNALILQRIREFRKDMEFGLLEEGVRAPTPR